MVGKQAPHIKRAQKESLLLKELSQLLMQISMDEPRLQGVFINRVELSQDKGTCYVLFYIVGGEQEFQKLMPILLLYKPSMRKSLSKIIPGRYTPQLVFKFDAQFEKQKRIEDLLEKLKEEGQL
jgi:ribosome-binding factor A